MFIVDFKLTEIFRQRGKIWAGGDCAQLNSVVKHFINLLKLFGAIWLFFKLIKGIILYKPCKVKCYPVY